MPARKKARKRAIGGYFRNVRVEIVADYANTLLREIKKRFGHVISFTRDDCMGLPVLEFQQVAFGSRYRSICIAIAYLVANEQLIEKKFPDLCLPERADAYAYEPTSTTYAKTIRRLVTTMPATKPFVLMEVVQRWRTDPELTNDSKRKAVRNGIRPLVREGVCERLSRFEYKVGAINE